MLRFPRWRLVAAVATVLMLGGLGPALAQESFGGLDVTVVDTEGAELPGATAELTGGGAPLVQVTNNRGVARFPRLDPGRYALSVTLEGFSTMEHSNVVINLGRTTSVVMTLSPAVEEVITVTSESPLMDESRVVSGTTVSQIELEKIPTARDPWALLNQAPGVLVDRINVAGNESGQQAVFRGPGVSSSENDFLVDGIQITDMAAIGASPTYYDFDQFEEMQITTGGTDVSKAAAGVSVNLVSKRGTNEFRGSGRFIITDTEFFGGALEQADSGVDESDFPADQGVIATNRINRIEDFGIEAGGPIVRDRLFGWLSWGENDIKQFAAGGQADDTILENTAVKLNAQFTASNSALGLWNNGDKVKFGRGASPLRARDTTWNQRGPSALIKFEDTHIFTSEFFLTGAYHKMDLGFQLDALGGGFKSDAPETLWDSDGVWKNNFISGRANRPGEEWKVDGSYFFNAGNTSNELKFGGRFRDFASESPFGWGGRSIVHVAGENFGQDPGPVDFFFLYRSSPAPVEQEYTSFWVQDTLTAGNFTANIGLRYDLQEGSNLADSVDANAAVPEVLPGLDFPGNDAGGFDWTSISPRLGVTYALGETRDTLLQASLARFPEALSTGNIRHVNPLGASYAYFYFIDGNDNNMWDGRDESFGFLSGSGFDPSNPSSLVSPNETDPGLDPNLTDELILGVQHSFLPEFVVGLQGTYREVTDILETRTFVSDGGVKRLQTRDDFVLETIETVTRPDGSTIDVPQYRLRDGLSLAGGSLLTNGDRERSFQGIALTATKRLSNRWMLRGFIQWGEDEWDIPDSYFFFNGPNDGQSSADNDGQLFVEQSAGSGKSDIWLQSSWTWNVNGMYQVAPDRPWGFNVAFNAFGREGYPIPFFVSRTGGDGVSRGFSAVRDIDEFRNDDPFQLDLRLEKEIRATGNVSMTLSLEAFNVSNDGGVLGRQDALDVGTEFFITDAQAPRTYRIGARLNWR